MPMQENRTFFMFCMTPQLVRNTKNRQRRSADRVKEIQSEILSHLVSRIPPQNVVLLEAPPLLDSPSSDIFEYNQNSFLLSLQFGVRFAKTLVGEGHMWQDGYHVHRSFRHLLLKSVSAAAAKVDAHEHFRLARPPFGHFGPWEAPVGLGMTPPNFRDVAMGRPMYFRQQRQNLQPFPLMDMNTHRFY